MRKRLLLGIVVVLYTACLVLAGWKCTHPVRNLNSVVKNRWNSYSQQYILGYTPANLQRDGKYRKVQVKLVQPKGLPPLRESHRQGYYAPIQ